MRQVFLIVLAVIICSEVAISFNSALLPNLEASFHISHQIAQTTIALGLFALGLAGIIYGGISDCIGRRPIYIFSVALFCVMSIFCATANKLEHFMIARFFQGFGSGAGWIIGNACLKDLYSGKEYQKVMNHIHAAAGVLFAIAPILGSELAAIYSWQLCFYSLACFSALVLFALIIWQPETLKQKNKLSLQYFINTYKILFRNKKFLRHLTIKVAAVAMLFCELSQLPIILVDFLKIAPENYGWFLLPGITAYIAIAVLAGKSRISSETQIYYGYILLMTSNILLLFLNKNPYIIQCINIGTFAGWGLIFGNATSKVIESAANNAGAGSALMITTEMLFSSIAIYVLSIFFHGSIITVASFISIISAIIIWQYRPHKPK